MQPRILEDHFDTFIRKSLWKEWLVWKEIKEFKSAYISVIDVDINSAFILTMVRGRNQQIWVPETEKWSYIAGGKLCGPKRDKRQATKFTLNVQGIFEILLWTKG